jgi:hypothetical protein
MNPNSTAVFSFPIKAPDGAVTRDDVSALSQLELCLAYQRHWCEHKPSITVTVREDEWMDVGAWVYKHFDEVSGGSCPASLKLSYTSVRSCPCTTLLLFGSQQSAVIMSVAPSSWQLHGAAGADADIAVACRCVLPAL